MSSQVGDQAGAPPAPSFPKAGEDNGSTKPKGGEDNGSTKPNWVPNDLFAAFLLHLLGIVAVVVLFVIAARLHDGSAKDLLAVTVTAVTTLAASGGGHAYGRAKRRED